MASLSMAIVTNANLLKTAKNRIYQIYAKEIIINFSSITLL